MALPFQLRCALFVLLFHGMGLCVAAEQEASAGAAGDPVKSVLALLLPRAQGISGELERFYALGIDAFRVASALLDQPRGLSLDGVTGRLTLYGNVVAREPVQAVFRNGVGVTLDHDAAGAGTR